jgi:RNase P subunit RPR2
MSSGKHQLAIPHDGAHLRCLECGEVLIADFWCLVAAERVATFSSVTVACLCGTSTRHDLLAYRTAIVPRQLYGYRRA